MQEQAPFYPVRVRSRSVSKRRSKRASWFVFGAGFGIGCSLILSSTSLVALPSAVIEAATMHRMVAMEEPTSETPVTKGIDVVALAITSPLAPAAPPVKIAEAKPAPAMYPLALDLKVMNGDTLMNILTDTGVSYEEAHNAVGSMGKLYNPKKLDIGQSVSVILDKGMEGSETPIIASLKLPISATDVVHVTRKDTEDAFIAKKVTAPVERKLARAAGRIDSSLYETGMAQGVPVSILSEIIGAYSYDIDFQRDIQPGDNMDVLFERLQTKEGVVAGHGNVLFAELDISGKNMKIYRYVDKKGNADYYNEKGESVRKALLRTPINGAKITSGFGMRNHPIMGYSKMHRGVDFGAPTGTPVYAAGDGTVSYSGRKGSYGNYLSIKHNNKYSSAYGHLSRFASGISSGKKVKQGQIVAYVGSTGMSTGPHLHYEILSNNTQVNPSGVKFKTGTVLQGKELAAFRKNVEQIQAHLAVTPKAKTDVAMATIPPLPH
jgi:murein DD-endopeptidase MepM/ murein hydrolase activator NlpD